MMARHLPALVLVVLSVACAKEVPERSAEAISPTVQPVAAVHRIEDPSFVCMVNDAYMGRAQIPVEVDGKTYFGCCDMCKGRLANEPGTRTATDPVSGTSVDKAAAILAMDAAGKVLYFDSEETLRRYRP
jgi:YHS domain-containing protein